MSWLPSLKDFAPIFEQIKIPPRSVGNRGRFSNMSGLSYLTCVKLNWPISNLRSESERKYSNRTRTIAGSPLSRPLPSYSKANLGITHTESLLAGYFCPSSPLPPPRRKKRLIDNDRRLHIAKTYWVVTIRTRIIPRGMKFSCNLIFLRIFQQSSKIKSSETKLPPKKIPRKFTPTFYLHYWISMKLIATV